MFLGLILHEGSEDGCLHVPGPLVIALVHCRCYRNLQFPHRVPLIHYTLVPHALSETKHKGLDPMACVQWTWSPVEVYMERAS